MSDKGMVEMIEVVLAQVAEAIVVSKHLGTIIPGVEALEVENRRLRKIEKAARAILDPQHIDQPGAYDALRAALEKEAP